MYVGIKNATVESEFSKLIEFSEFSKLIEISFINCKVLAIISTGKGVPY